MKKNLLITPLLVFICLNTFAQEQKVLLDESKKLGSATKSQPFNVQCLGETNTQSADLKWRPLLTNKCIAREPRVPGYEVIEKMKGEKLILKQQQNQNNKKNNSELSTQTVTPVMGTNYLGNTNNGMSPLDNSIAISNGGIIVSVANNSIEVDDISGNNLYYNDIPAFFNDPNITNTCDPVVIYDKLADKFIFFFQVCSGTSANTYLCISFSKTNNPATGGWWSYKITGNPLNDNSAFDYPKMAVSNNELYITGNLFYDSGGYNQSILYQIPKAAGYSGGSLNWQYFNNISGDPFTLLPVADGHGASFGPGCYLVSTTSAGSSSINLYDLTDDMSASNETLNHYSIPTTAYSPAGNASQSGTSCLLDNGDCRTLSGFYLNGIIHFVFHSDIGSGWNGINYNRLTLVGSPTNQSSMYGLAGSFDYSYPSVASYATSATDKSVMIGFGRASSSIYPEVRVVNCDDAMNWSSSTLIKSSSSYVGSGTTERWGDYTGTSRKHNSSTPSIWMNGMYGTSSNLWNTWIAEVHGTPTGIIENQNTNNVKVFPNPVVENATIEFSLIENTNLEISVFDISGKMVKELYKGKGQQGENVFSFNKANLSTGTYFVVIKNNLNTIKNEKIIIAD